MTEKTMKKNRPVYCTDEHLEYLDDLRESGITNMYGASPYIKKEFGVSNNEAIEILSYWMNSFSDRHPKG